MPLLTDKLFPLQIISNLELSAQSYFESILLSIFVMYTGVWWYRKLSVWRRWEKLYIPLWQWGYHFNKEGLYYAFCWTFLRNYIQLKITVFSCTFLMPLLTDKLFPLQIISNLELSAQSYLESILLSIFVMYTGVWWYRRLSVWQRWEKLSCYFYYYWWGWTKLNVNTQALTYTPIHSHTIWLQRKMDTKNVIKINQD